MFALGLQNYRKDLEMFPYFPVFLQVTLQFLWSFHFSSSKYCNFPRPPGVNSGFELRVWMSSIHFLCMFLILLSFCPTLMFHICFCYIGWYSLGSNHFWKKFILVLVLIPSYTILYIFWWNWHFSLVYKQYHTFCTLNTLGLEFALMRFACTNRLHQTTLTVFHIKLLKKFRWNLNSTSK